MKKRYSMVETASSVALLLVAFSAFASVIDRFMGRLPHDAVEASAQDRVVQDWRSFATDGHVRGDSAAGHAIIVFSDFQCPACRIFTERLAVAMEGEVDDIRLVYRHFPIPNHPEAGLAAHASECASEQGRFWEMHDLLFEKQNLLADIPMWQLAQNAGVGDIQAFRQCIEGPFSPSVERDLSAGRDLGVTGTPTILFDSQLVRGAPTLSAIRESVRRMLGSDEVRN